MSYFSMVFICLVAGIVFAILCLVLEGRSIKKKYNIEKYEPSFATMFLFFLVILAFFFVGMIGEKNNYILQDVELGQKYHAVNLSGTNKFFVLDGEKIKILTVNNFKEMEADSLSQTIVAKEDSTWEGKKYKKIIYYK